MFRFETVKNRAQSEIGIIRAIIIIDHLFQGGEMIIWSIVMFALGAAAFLDSFYNFGGIFRPANAFLFMLLSLGILFRTRMLTKLRRTETLEKRTEELLVKNAELQSQLDHAKGFAADQKTSQMILY